MVEDGELAEADAPVGCALAEDWSPNSPLSATSISMATSSARQVSGGRRSASFFGISRPDAISTYTVFVRLNLATSTLRLLLTGGLRNWLYRVGKALYDNASNQDRPACFTVYPEVAKHVPTR